tara:strand:- start:464 stop:1162 length:699 start_codon:yes stop_codon:yes gene_type:complete
MLDNKILVFDDLINIEYQQQIKDTLMGTRDFKKQSFPWYYTKDVTAASDTHNQARPALAHRYVIYNHDEKKAKLSSEHHQLFVPLLKSACARIGVKDAKALQGRSFLQFPLNLKDTSIDSPHIDLFFRHMVVLYYVCDSDGDTVLYNQRYTGKEKLGNLHLIQDQFTERQSVSPKQGRTVIFDGTIFHTAQQPINNIRCVVNYNLIYDSTKLATSLEKVPETNPETTGNEGT